MEHRGLERLSVEWFQVRTRRSDWAHVFQCNRSGRFVHSFSFQNLFIEKKLTRSNEVFMLSETRYNVVTIEP